MENQTEVTRMLINDLFSKLSRSGLGQKFLDHLSDNVIWRATGTSPLNGTTTSKQAYKDNVLAKLHVRLENAPVPTTDMILAGGAWATVLFHITSVRAKYGLDFSVQYCWLMRVEHELLTEVWGFYDQQKMTELFGGGRGRGVGCEND